MNDLREFWNFLGSWFPDADMEGVDDDVMVIRNFIQTGNTTKAAEVLAGCKQVLAMETLPVEKITDEANRHFENEVECRAWLIQIRDELASAGTPANGGVN